MYVTLFSTILVNEKKKKSKTNVDAAFIKYQLVDFHNIYVLIFQLFQWLLSKRAMGLKKEYMRG